MKKSFLIICLVALLFSTPAFSDESSQLGYLSGGATDVWSVEFYRDANVLYGGLIIPFTNIDPTKSFVESDGRTLDSSKSDTGVIVRTNLNKSWDLKMEVTTSSDFNLANFKYYMGQPWNRKLNKPADGRLAVNPPAWTSVPTISTTVYSAGPNDLNQAELGTLATTSFSIYPAGMKAGVTYIMNITFTIVLTA